MASVASPLRHSALNEKVKQVHLATTKDICDPELMKESQTFSLGHKVYLSLVPCNHGAYQMSYKVYMLNSGEVSTVSILGYDSKSGVRPNDNLMMVSYDPATSLLTTQDLGRGLGDCGESTVSKIMVADGTYYIRTTEIRYKEECDEQGNEWPVVFKQ